VDNIVILFYTDFWSTSYCW